MASRRESSLALSCFVSSLARPVRIPSSSHSAREIWCCSCRGMAAILALRPRERERLAAFRRNFSSRDVFAELAAKKIQYVELGGDGYPPRLSQIFDPPYGLFCITERKGGPEEVIGDLNVAIVGARAASRYGLDVTRALAGELSSYNVCVISGMALGVDAEAHRSAIDDAGGTVAVLGCGIDVAYPRAHSSLYDRIAASGAVISEYPPGNRPLPWRFPARNRIIAGISRGVVVVEARAKSGALITADFCLEQGGEVFAVPGSIYSELSAGPHRLISEGATLITGAGEILMALGLDHKVKADDAQLFKTVQDAENAKPAASARSGNGAEAATSPPEAQQHEPLNAVERAIYDAMDGQPRHQDLLASRAGLDSKSAAAALLKLEMLGLARLETGRGYSR